MEACWHGKRQVFPWNGRTEPNRRSEFAGQARRHKRPTVGKLPGHAIYPYNKRMAFDSTPAHHSGKPGKDLPLSLVAITIVKEALKPNASVQQLGIMAERDPAFAIRVVSAVNSAAFGMSRRVSDVSQAASLLGIRGLRNLALSFALSDMVPVSEKSAILLSNSLRRAVATRLIAEAKGIRRVDEFFTAGLLLEVGLLSRARTDLDAVAELASTPALHRVICERASGVQDHPTTGAAIARDFKLPEETVLAVLHHHDATPHASEIGQATWAAERLSAVWEGGALESIRSGAALAMNTIGLSDAQAQGIIERLPQLVTEAASAFQRDVKPQESVDELLVHANRSLVEMNQNYEGIIRRLEALIAEKEALAIELKQANAKLGDLASTDSLTTLLNKRSFEEAFTRDLARAERQQQPISIVMLDLDRFKNINDTHGHQAGDDVLKQVGKRIKATLRTSDVAARYGGEEFIMILPQTNLNEARITAERVRVSIAREPIDTCAGKLEVTASLGAASRRGKALREQGSALIANADAALYKAKRTGRNCVVTEA